MNCDGGKTDPYAVGRLDFKGWRAHAGILHDGKTRWFVGADFPINGELTGMVDHLSGSDGYTYVGVYQEFAKLPGFGVTWTLGIPNDRGSGFTHMVTLGYCFRF
jgi:hypothetical protein